MLMPRRHYLSILENNLQHFPRSISTIDHTKKIWAYLPQNRMEIRLRSKTKQSKSEPLALRRQNV